MDLGLIFIQKQDGILAWEAKEYFLEQEKCVEVQLESKTYHGYYTEEGKKEKAEADAKRKEKIKEKEKAMKRQKKDKKKAKKKDNLKADTKKGKKVQKNNKEEL